MTNDERLKYCRICENRTLNPSIGIICSLTKEKPAFEGNCQHTIIDQQESNRLTQLALFVKRAEASKKRQIIFRYLGGVLMISIAIIWFIAAIAVNGDYSVIPFVLFIIGAYWLTKAIATLIIDRKNQLH
jgi:hypothetical protein